MMACYLCKDRSMLVCYVLDGKHFLVDVFFFFVTCQVNWCLVHFPQEQHEAISV